MVSGEAGVDSMLADLAFEPQQPGALAALVSAGATVGLVVAAGVASVAAEGALVSEA